MPPRSQNRKDKEKIERRKKRQEDKNAMKEIEDETVQVKKLFDNPFEFDCSSCGEAYKAFIERFSSEFFLPRHLVSGLDSPIYRKKPFVSEIKGEKYYYFDIAVSARERPLDENSPVRKVSFRFLQNNLYFIAFHPEGAIKDEKPIWYELKGWDQQKKITGLSMTPLSNGCITVHYASLEIDTPRRKLPLGQNQLRKSVLNLSLYENDHPYSPNRYSPKCSLTDDLLTIAQMFSEPIRFSRIVSSIYGHYVDGKSLPLDLVDLENDWSELSKKFIANLLHESVRAGFRMLDLNADDLSVLKLSSMFDYEEYVKNMFRVINSERSNKSMKKYGDQQPEDA